MATIFIVDDEDWFLWIKEKNLSNYSDTSRLNGSC